MNRESLDEALPASRAAEKTLAMLVIWSFQLMIGLKPKTEVGVA